MLLTSILVNFCGLNLTLTFLSMTFVLMQISLRHDMTYTSTLGEYEVFAAHLTDPRAQNANTLRFKLRSDLDLTHDFNLELLSRN